MKFNSAYLCDFVVYCDKGCEQQHDLCKFCIKILKYKAVHRDKGCNIFRGTPTILETKDLDGIKQKHYYNRLIAYIIDRKLAKS